MVIHHLADAGDAAGGEGFDGAGRDGIHPDVLWAEVVSEITDGCFKRCLGNPHNVVVRHDPLRSEVGQRDDGAAIGHQRQGRFCHGDERIGADVQGHGETLAGGIDELACEFFARREGHRMDQKVECADFFLHVLHQGSNLGVVSNIARECFRARHGGNEFLDVFPQPLVLIVEDELRPLAGCRLGNGPGNAVFVRHANDESFFTVE